MGKLAIIVHSFTGGGAEKIAVNLANYYATSDKDVDLVVFDNQGPYVSSINERVNVVDLKVAPRRYWPYRLGTYRALIRYFKIAQPVYVLSMIDFVNVITGISSYFWRPRRVVFRQANTLDDIRRRGRGYQLFYDCLLKVAYRKADRIIANSPDTKLDLLLHRIIPESKTVVIQNPVLPLNHQELLAEDINEPWLNDNSFFVVLGVGRLYYQKNFSFLIRAFSEVYAADNRARLIILGEGEEYRELSALVKELGLSNFVKIIEFQENVYPFYAKAHVFALSSRWEGFGNVLVEAISAGTSVVSVNCPGGPKMILENSKYGRLIKPGDRKGFSSAILEEFDLPLVSSEVLIERSKEYAVDYVADKYFEAISGM